MRHAFTTSTILGGLLFTSGCHVGGNSVPIVDGVRLPAKHVETLAIEAWDAAGLEVEAVRGDLILLPGEGPTTITVTLHEVETGDATAFYEDGRLLPRTHSGQPAAIGRVTVSAHAPLPSLVFLTGLGDVVVDDVRVVGAVRIETGLGDVTVTGIGSPTRIRASSGLGDIEVSGAECTTLVASSGMGDIQVWSVSADDAKLDSGMGDVEVHHSVFHHLRADTGMGDVECNDTSCVSAHLDSGLGSVKRN